MIEFVVTEGLPSNPIHTDALIVLASPNGPWLGRDHQAIKTMAGNHYHRQLDAQWINRVLIDGEVIVATGDKERHRGYFNNVLFVIDEGLQPLADLVHTALKVANQQGYHHVLMPLLRDRTAIGQEESDSEGLVRQMVLGMEYFIRTDKLANIRICVVIYENGAAVRQMGKEMARLDQLSHAAD